MDDILGKVRGSERESDHVDENDHHHHDADGHVVPEKVKVFNELINHVDENIIVFNEP